MNEFEDPVLRDQLQRLGGHGPDEDSAYLRMQQRVRIAKRRRAAAVLGGLGVTLMLGFAATAYQQPTVSHLAPADGGGNDAFIPVSTVSESTESAPSSSSEPVEVTLATVAANSVASVPSNADQNTGSTQKHGNSGSSHGGTVASDTTTASTLQPPVTTKPAGGNVPVPPATFIIKTGYSSMGSASVKLENGKLTFLTVSEISPFTCSPDKQESDRVRVRCHGDVNGNSATSHIEFSLNNGQIEVSVTES
jgi:hypothetical protein